MNSFSPTEDTIAAIATAVSPGQGSIAAIRISGSSAIEISKSVVHVPGMHHWSSHKVLYGHVTEANQKKYIDEVLILIMKGPRSFTGEDIVEIHCHGGIIAVQKILERILDNPNVRRAEPGEFSQRAVINGRLSLTQAESISELVSARSKKAAELAMNGIEGNIQTTVQSIRHRLLDQLTEIEARIDFEEDLPKLEEENIKNEIFAIKKDLNKLIDNAKRGTLIRSGLKVALIGKPNVGKSSLMNRLTKKEKAIVTDLPGTTRDLLESEIVLEGIPVTFIDTAGIRETKDIIENIGISRTQEALKQTDLIVLIFDCSTGWTNEDESILKQIPTSIPLLIVGNKSDLNNLSSSKKDTINTIKKENLVIISAKTGDGEEDLINCLLKLCGSSQTHGLDIALNERQLDLAKSTIKSLENIDKVFDEKLPWDFWTIDLRQAINHLGELTGDDLTESLLDNIFSKFCIGK
ncbi:tRNA uridine-5-carboxymethylaminomethyl(34) synthesis GTPase MnmE [Prochlorococcus marinus]|uniref:tRNA modification GTPase MnmE n=1 Tax=Prochlorococcus marinus XMU1408 TaxID=2213228 RepID=A0A318R678_PROMR|nr:tRNA uridine-5-carboxymethylaminomethyl(34) synthesis GTPase MnmE [Prochlorococcus marinus]MBW3041250.1 tRNA uridine-5-carboxymethylaminomethyl(34) synthesis GTPase MnmE [Prochlorococcus marinus str. XMU1408]PYE03839.1 tRNA uridine-5-carboxymethylaminomethyl(34) synthesis GTPase MnmE [Prochlorococcus marinus XMU1408]